MNNLTHLFLVDSSTFTLWTAPLPIEVASYRVDSLEPLVQNLWKASVIMKHN